MRRSSREHALAAAQRDELSEAEQELAAQLGLERTKLRAYTSRLAASEQEQQDLTDVLAGLKAQQAPG